MRDSLGSSEDKLQVYKYKYINLEFTKLHFGHFEHARYILETELASLFLIIEIASSILIGAQIVLHVCTNCKIDCDSFLFVVLHRCGESRITSFDPIYTRHFEVVF